MLPRPGQLPVRTREQRVGPRSAPQVQHDGSIRPRASPGAAVRGLRDLLSLSRPTCHSFFTGPVFLLGRAVRPHSPGKLCADGRELVLHDFAWRLTFSQAVCAVTDGENSFLHGFCMVFWHDMILLDFACCWHDFA